MCRLHILQERLEAIRSDIAALVKRNDEPLAQSQLAQKREEAYESQRDYSILSHGAGGGGDAG